MGDDTSQPDTHDDLFDQLFDPEPAEPVARIKEVDESGRAWHVGLDFLDPLADEVEEWLDDFEGTAQNLEDLTYIFIAIVRDVGSQQAEDDWRRARAWFDVHGPVGFADLFLRSTTKVFEDAQALWGHCLNQRSEEDQPNFGYFEIRIIEPYIDNLRDWSRELKLHFPPGAPPAKPGKGKGDGGADLTSRSKAPPGKRKVGRPRGSHTPETIRRAKFGRPLRAKGKTWPAIAAAFRTTFPKDLEASADTIRQACTRIARKESDAAIQGQ